MAARDDKDRVPSGPPVAESGSHRPTKQRKLSQHRYEVAAPDNLQHELDVWIEAEAGSWRNKKTGEVATERPPPPAITVAASADAREQDGLWWHGGGSGSPAEGGGGGGPTLSWLAGDQHRQQQQQQQGEEKARDGQPSAEGSLNADNGSSIIQVASVDDGRRCSIT